MEKMELGPEHDENLFATLKGVLSELNASGLDSTWGVGGSQEVSEWTVTIGNEVLKIEAETYMGLSISGSSELVKKIAELIKRKTCN